MFFFTCDAVVKSINIGHISIKIQTLFSYISVFLHKTTVFCIIYVNFEFSLFLYFFFPSFYNTQADMEVLPDENKPKGDLLCIFVFTNME